MTSTIRSYAQYFMINGQAYTNGLPPLYAGTAGSNCGKEERTIMCPGLSRQIGLEWTEGASGLGRSATLTIPSCAAIR